MPTDAGALSEPFRELFELSPDAILIYLDGNVTHANPAAGRLLRASAPSELVGRASRDLIAKESLPLVASNAAALMSGAAESTRGEERYVCLDGTLVDVEATAARASFYDGKAFIVFLRDIRDRKEAEQRRRQEREATERTRVAEERERWLRQIIDHLPILVYARDDRGAFILANRQCAEFFGRRVEEILGRTLAELGHVEGPALSEEDAELLRTGLPKTLTERALHDGRGKVRVFEGAMVPFRRADGRVAVLGALTELTARRTLEAQLLHSQKMESIGRLAGGVAHDFNNLLTVILESTEQLAKRVPDPEGDLPRIREASTRAAALTRQLLAFAHRAPVKPRVVAVDPLVARVAHLLERVVGEDVKLETRLGAPDACASVDEGQLEVVLMNVAVNARDAMPDGGTLVLATRLAEEQLRPAAPQVPCVVLEVHDTGVGMTEETRSRAFEPFFTTKPLGQGTGLGLSTCYGIVQQLGGRIEIASTPGRGTSVLVVLPVRIEARPDGGLAPAVLAPKPTETVLLLEDDPAVRRSTARMLRARGYTVLEAGLPGEALDLAREHPGAIDALVSDVVMPELNGVEAAAQFRACRPGAAVVFASGYSRDILTGRAVGERFFFVAKPFTGAELDQALREALAASRGS